MAILPRTIGDPQARARGFALRPLKGPLESSIAWAFHRLYYSPASRTWSNTYWLGTQTQKCPLDLWIYQEILHELQPAAIVETGTASGGSALFLASVCDLLGHGEIMTVDIVERKRPAHPRVTYVSGSSTAPETAARVRQFVGDRSPVLVILDSDHSKTHVTEELRLYSPLVTPGSYVVVEDTNVNGHPVAPEHGPRPMEAVREFLEDSPEFVVDEAREKFFLTFNPHGFLRRR